MRFQTVRSVLEALSRTSAYPILRRLLPGLIVGIAIAFMIRFVSREYDAIGSNLESLQWAFLSLAVATSFLSTGCGGIVWLWAIRSLRGQISPAAAVRAWCLSAPGKYGLGAVGQYVGRIYFAERLGLGRPIVLGSLALELAVIGVSGLSLAVLLSPTAAAFLFPHPPLIVLYGAILGAVMVIAVWPYVVERLTQFLQIRTTRLERAPRARELHFATAAMVVDWFLFGATLFFIVRAMGSLDPDLYLYFVFSTTVSILLGLIGITPMGLGVRDVTMALLLSHAVPASEATIAVVLHRMATAISELACAGLALCLQQRSLPFLRAFRVLK